MYTPTMVVSSTRIESVGMSVSCTPPRIDEWMAAPLEGSDPSLSNFTEAFGYRFLIFLSILFGSSKTDEFPL